MACSLRRRWICHPQHRAHCVWSGCLPALQLVSTWCSRALDSLQITMLLVMGTVSNWESVQDIFVLLCSGLASLPLQTLFRKAVLTMPLKGQKLRRLFAFRRTMGSGVWEKLQIRHLFFFLCTWTGFIPHGSLDIRWVIPGWWQSRQGKNLIFITYVMLDRWAVTWWNRIIYNWDLRLVSGWLCLYFTKLIDNHRACCPMAVLHIIEQMNNGSFYHWIKFRTVIEIFKLHRRFTFHSFWWNMCV